MKEFLIWGLCRSGNHALGGFLMEHMEVPEHLQKLSPYDRYNAFKENFMYLNNYLKRPQNKFPVPLPKYGSKQIISFENAGDVNRREKHYSRILTDVNKLNFPTGRKKVKRYIFVILRDPYNWFASYFPTIPKKKYYIQLWKEYAKKFFLEKNPFWFPVNYNKMCESLSYRKSISKYIEEPFTDDGMHTMISSGSTFTKREFCGRALEMPLKERWKNLPEKMFNKYLANDEELAFLSKQIFGFNVNDLNR